MCPGGSGVPRKDQVCLEVFGRDYIYPGGSQVYSGRSRYVKEDSTASTKVYMLPERFRHPDMPRYDHDEPGVCE